MSDAKPAERRHRKKFIGAILFVAFFVFDLAAGTVVEAARKRAHERFVVAEQRYRIHSPEYHHGLRPNVSIDDAGWGPLRYKVRTNSLGFRDRVVRDIPLVSPKRRILFIGDSFTEGVGVDYERTFPALIEDALVKRDASVEVLDAAAASYFPGIYLAKVRHLLNAGLSVSEVIVCIDISDADDEASEVYPPEAPESASPVSTATAAGAAPTAAPSSGASAPEGAHMTGALKPNAFLVFLHDHTLVTFNVLKALKDAIAPPLPPEVVSPRGLWTVREDAWETFGAIGNERCVRHMDELARILAARKIPLTVAVYPWPAQVYFHDIDSKQVRIWRDWAARRGARFVNVFPAFVTNDPPMETIHRYFIAGDVHWNEAGHRLVAETILGLGLWR